MTTGLDPRLYEKNRFRNAGAQGRGTWNLRQNNAHMTTCRLILIDKLTVNNIWRERCASLTIKIGVLELRTGLIDQRGNQVQVAADRLHAP